MDILIDCHSFFDVDLAIDVARRLEPQKLAWYEEPVAPTDVAATKAIERGIEQRMAGGEFLFGIEGFGPLCREQAVDVIMPDVKHCGGLLEARKIAAVAELDHIAVSPHNPSGPVATAVSAQLCAGLPNFEILETQWGEAAWRGRPDSAPGTLRERLDRRAGRPRPRRRSEPGGRAGTRLRGSAAASVRRVLARKFHRGS